MLPDLTTIASYTIYEVISQSCYFVKDLAIALAVFCLNGGDGMEWVTPCLQEGIPQTYLKLPVIAHVNTVET